MAVVTMRQMLAAGVHFGHQTRRWNPKMRRYILGERNGIYLIDLRKTLEGVESAYNYVRDLVAGGGTVLFVGTNACRSAAHLDNVDLTSLFVRQVWTERRDVEPHHLHRSEGVKVVRAPRPPLARSHSQGG